MSRAMQLRHPFAFIAWTGTTLLFVVCLRFMPHRSGLVRFSEKGQAKAVVVPQSRSESNSCVCVLYYQFL